MTQVIKCLPSKCKALKEKENEKINAWLYLVYQHLKTEYFLPFSSFYFGGMGMNPESLTSRQMLYH
jgi:hypothetical protein